ncbi:component of 2-oxoglutarate dehydrogenase complex, mitochondrial [Seminavis robusta]|uniref:Lipoamide acyltransferase component of branched-chain alpha-keto acid dehydrogenase complex, mitochondrial n=1 Tax=Seminavis robusta TaxID=568900 RepID=A0A9N8HA95_9STRA|nr:component of 2-oxoglutarate dehydrogenase complex, mitochondrial [Seminavis robusta]|eukprot:Sro140_g065620.1 component of 2-oxoglutarate dehydrogenase complex, mitochondrial (231) ;mRNA; f:97926-98707
MTTTASVMVARGLLRRLPSSSRHVVPVVRSMVSRTAVLWDQKTIQLPGLGDSITEGTIVEWTAAVGQAVKEGDVVAMVETDKVTVDIKAEIDGVIMEQFPAVDDTVEVGADLYKIDTEGQATVTVAATDAAAPSPAAATEETAPPATAAAESAKSATTASATTRTPSIQFRGKDGWAKLRAAGSAPTIVHIPPMYGRPVFTQEEMDALVSGGADIAPQVKKHSSGAMFGY